MSEDNREQGQSAEAHTESKTTERTAEMRDIQLPQVTFATFVMSLASSALVQLGEVPDPDSGGMQFNLPVAKHTIDILSMLKEKTGNCLDPDESQLLEGLLYDLRMKYVMKKK